MTELENRILQIVSSSNGIKARDIALKLDCERSDVNSALYGALRDRCFQDSSYRWHLKNHATQVLDSDIVQPDKQLSDLCKYYLNCLSLEQNSGISAFLTSRYSLDYLELSTLAVDSSKEDIANLIRRISSGRNLIAHVGYPVMIERIHSTRTNQDYLKVAPVFLFPLEIEGGAVNVAPVPHVNMEVIKQFSSRDINNQIYDLVDLESELGLNSQDADIEVDELVARLQSIREWQWKDRLDPDAISVDPPIASIEAEGIYNKAILIVSERSPYTVGLESELSRLAQMDEKSYQGTALYDWVHYMCNESSLIREENVPLLEVLPMNSEQEDAIRHASHNKLTIVTGPPGTGKSQVVTNLMINAAWNGTNALFTSKNNKAVDVVETRVNALGKRPIMLRIGNNQYANHLAEIISNLLSYSADQGDHEEYQRYHALYQSKLSTHRSLQEKKATAIGLRNHADHLEQKACELREKWKKWFGHISERDVEIYDAATRRLLSAHERWSRAKRSFLGKFFWFAIGKKKDRELSSAMSEINELLSLYEQPTILAASVEADGINNFLRTKEHLQAVSYALRTIAEYKLALEDLLEFQQPEDIDREIINNKCSLAEIAEKLWDKWLVTRPLQMDAACRREMNEYISAIKLINGEDINEHPDLRRKFNRLQEKMTNFLPCWAVTSLSAKGRIPFEKGLFDLVVIDEASQCDIASVLPMLYRAKRAIIIGDPKQLSHISTISKAQDLSLIQKYGVNIGWSYSATSLYDLASSLVEPNQIIQLRDHHRSYGEIIEFSNAEFYDGKLRVATNYDRLKYPRNTEAGIRWNDMVGQTIRPSSGGAYNETEVAGIIAEIKRLVIDNDYAGTVGVVTPFRAQADKINAALNADPVLRDKLVSKNDFLVDTVHKFQGDERDVMFFSPVISRGTNQGALGFLRNTGNLFNVAITRARAALVVVGDMSYCATCGVSYMEHFVDYIRQRNTLRNMAEGIATDTISFERTYPKVANPEQVSDWERLLYTALYDCGIHTIPQYPVDKYKLDLAIIMGERMLDIEVDGEMYHRDWNGELSYRDQLRNQRLFELGWDMKRFWVYQIRDDLQGCIDQIKQWCNAQT